MPDEQHGPISLQVHCVSCGRPVTLRYAAVTEGAAELKTWACPYRDCHGDRLNWIKLPAPSFEAWRGHGPEPFSVKPTATVRPPGGE